MNDKSKRDTQAIYNAIVFSPDHREEFASTFGIDPSREALPSVARMVQELRAENAALKARLQAIAELISPCPSLKRTTDLIRSSWWGFTSEQLDRALRVVNELIMQGVYDWRRDGQIVILDFEDRYQPEAKNWASVGEVRYEVSDIRYLFRPFTGQYTAEEKAHMDLFSAIEGKVQS